MGPGEGVDNPALRSIERIVHAFVNGDVSSGKREDIAFWNEKYSGISLVCQERRVVRFKSSAVHGSGFKGMGIERFEGWYRFSEL